jgi:hypothetical protein
MQGENPVPVLGLDTGRIEPDRKRQRAIEFANDTLSPMHADALRESDCLLAGIRMVFSLAWICRSFLSIPGNSMMARRSSPCWNTLIGGKPPRLVVES